MNNQDIISKVKNDLDIILGDPCIQAKVADAAIVRLPQAVNWYFPGSYRSMPEIHSSTLSNLFFAGDIVRTRHGSWSQEKAYVTGIEAANRILRRNHDFGVIPLTGDEAHVAFGRFAVESVKQILKSGYDKKEMFSLLDFVNW